MKRVSSVFFGLTLAASMAGCGSGSNNNNQPPPADMAKPAQDMAMGPADMLMLKHTGESCMNASECSPSVSGNNKKALCLKSSTLAGKPITWTGGFCTSGCQDAQNDKVNGINQACPTDLPATCVNNQCMLICNSIADCMRDTDKYVCANVTPTGAICLPQNASGCDPKGDPIPAMKNCMAGQTCVDYSQDKTYGECAPLCDPLDQSCMQPNMGMNGCVLDSDLMNGQGTCIGVFPGNEGDPCQFLNGCNPGMQCLSGKCRQYCRTGQGPDGGTGDGGVMGPIACPMGQKCIDIQMAGVKANVVGICSP